MDRDAYGVRQREQLNNLVVHYVLECWTFEELHEQDCRLGEAEKAHNIWVVQSGQGVDFSPRPLGRCKQLASYRTPFAMMPSDANDIAVMSVEYAQGSNIFVESAASTDHGFAGGLHQTTFSRTLEIAICASNSWAQRVSPFNKSRACHPP
jgi:hypothetical protein